MSDKPTSPRQTPNGFHVVRFALGAILLVAASLKAIALLNGQSAGPVLASPRWQIAVIDIEVLLGLWLISGVNLRGAWLAAIVLFTGLSGFTLYLALNGQQTCKCFGDVPVSPWLTFSLDVAAVLALLLWRPAQAYPPTDAWLRTAFQTVLGAGAFLALIGGAFLLASDDPVRALARLRSKSLTSDVLEAEEDVAMTRFRREAGWLLASLGLALLFLSLVAAPTNTAVADGGISCMDDGCESNSNCDVITGCTPVGTCKCKPSTTCKCWVGTKVCSCATP